MPMQLFPHNKTAYEVAVKMLAERKKAAVIHPTGTGVYTAPTAHFARYFCPLVPLLPTDVPNTHKHNFIV